MSQAVVGWYGDDFTGATDTLAVLAQAGLRALLFTSVPDAPRRAAAERALGAPLQAVGIAGAARAMAPAAMAAELEPVGAFFAGLRVPVLHYKVCSTFDSAPETGNIATAVRVLRRHVENAFVPVVGGQPSLERYCAFSNLFAAAGRGGPVERIDRHPTMRSHPVTPMREADLRQHLALQGLEPVAALHYPGYARPWPVQEAALGALLARDPAAVLLDVAATAHLAPVGRMVWEQARRRRLLAVGASSVAQALIAHWQASGEGPSRAASAGHALGPATEPVLVFAGSLSPVTARQVQAARSFQHLPLAASELMDEAGAAAAAARIGAALESGRHVLASTAPAQSADTGTAPTGAVAAASARFVRRLLEQAAARGRPLRRVGIAGGDTSSLAVQALEPWGLSYLGALGAGVTVSRTHSAHPPLDGIALMLKGGQMGAEDVFEQLLRGWS